MYLRSIYERTCDGRVYCVFFRISKKKLVVTFVLVFGKSSKFKKKIAEKEIKLKKTLL